MPQGAFGRRSRNGRARLGRTGPAAPGGDGRAPGLCPRASGARSGQGGHGLGARRAEGEGGGGRAVAALLCCAAAFQSLLMPALKHTTASPSLPCFRYVVQTTPLCAPSSVNAPRSCRTGERPRTSPRRTQSAPSSAESPLCRRTPQLRQRAPRQQRAMAAEERAVVGRARVARRVVAWPAAAGPAMLTATTPATMTKAARRWQRHRAGKRSAGPPPAKEGRRRAFSLAGRQAGGSALAWRAAAPAEASDGEKKDLHRKKAKEEQHLHSSSGGKHALLLRGAPLRGENQAAGAAAGTGPPGRGERGGKGGAGLDL